MELNKENKEQQIEKLANLYRNYADSVLGKWFNIHAGTINRWSTEDIKSELNNKPSKYSLQPFVIIFNSGFGHSNQFVFSLRSRGHFKNMEFVIRYNGKETKISPGSFVAGDYENRKSFLTSFVLPEGLGLFASPHDFILYLIVAFLYDDNVGWRSLETYHAQALDLNNSQKLFTLHFNKFLNRFKN